MSFFATESEKSALGCLMNYPDQSWPTFTSESVRIEHFTADSHKEIYRSISAMMLEGSPVNSSSVLTHLEGRGKIPTPVTLPLISELATGGTIPASIPSAIKNLKSKLMLRRLSGLFSDQNKAIESEGCDVSQIIESSMSELESIAGERQTVRHKTMKELVMGTVNRVIERGSGKEDAVGVKTGLPKFDRETGGMKTGAYWVIAGPAKGGKTAFALNLLCAAGLDAGRRSAFFGLEMPAEENVERMLCKIGKVRGQSVRDGDLKNVDIDNLTVAASKLISAPMIFRDSCFELSQIAAEIKQIKVVYPDLFAVFVDYTQLVGSTGASRQEQVANVSRTLRKISMQEGIFMAALSQLNDEGLIRESRTLMMDATCIVKIELDENPAFRSVKLTQRNGRSGVKIKMNYDGDFCNFTETDDRTEEGSIQEAPRKQFRPHPNARKR